MINSFELLKAARRIDDLQKQAAGDGAVSEMTGKLLNELTVSLQKQGALSRALAEMQAQLGREKAVRASVWNFSPDAYIVTSNHGTIIEVNRAAEEMLNVSQRFLANKPLVVFVSRDDHLPFFSAINKIASNQAKLIERLSLLLLPRDSESLAVTAWIGATPSARAESDELHWMLRRIDDSNKAQASLPECAGKAQLPSEHTYDLKLAIDNGDSLPVDEAPVHSARWIVEAVDDHSPVGWRALVTAAEIQHGDDKFEQAKVLYQRAAKQLLESKSHDDPEIAESLFYLGNHQLHEGNYVEAEQALSLALKILQTHSGCEQPYLPLVLYGLSLARCGQGQHQIAASHLKQLRKMLQQAAV